MRSLEETLEDFLRGEGLTDEPVNFDDGIHSWRCYYPDVYDPCSCFAATVKDGADAIRAWLTERLRDAGAGHVWPGGYFCSCGHELNSPEGFTRHVLDATVQALGEEFA